MVTANIIEFSETPMRRETRGSKGNSKLENLLRYGYIAHGSIQNVDKEFRCFQNSIKKCSIFKLIQANYADYFVFGQK